MSFANWFQTKPAYLQRKSAESLEDEPTSRRDGPTLNLTRFDLLLSPSRNEKKTVVYLRQKTLFCQQGNLKNQSKSNSTTQTVPKVRDEGWASSSTQNTTRKGKQGIELATLRLVAARCTKMTLSFLIFNYLVYCQIWHLWIRAEQSSPNLVVQYFGVSLGKTQKPVG